MTPSTGTFSPLPLQSVIGDRHVGVQSKCISFFFSNSHTDAYNHFLAPSTTKGGRERRIISAWLPESLNTNVNFSASALGYQGSLVLPREVFISSVKDVTSPLAFVQQKASWWSTIQDDGKHTIHTAGVRPVAEVSGLRHGSTHHIVEVDNRSLGGSKIAKILDAKSSSYELQTTITFGSSNASAGLVLRASATSGEQTIITYDPVKEELAINRNKSSLFSFLPDAPVNDAGYILSYEEMGKLRLWEVNGQKQPLNLRIYGACAVSGMITQLTGKQWITRSLRCTPAMCSSLLLTSIPGHRMRTRSGRGPMEVTTGSVQFKSGMA
jgi:hypothetical protein